MSEQDELDGLIDVPNLEDWLDRNLPELGNKPLTASRLTGGISNAVFKISRGGDAMVLRRPPKAPRPDSERIISREARVLRALNETDVPAPHFHVYCDDPEVTGAKFYVMEFIDGWLGSGGPTPKLFAEPGEHRYNLPFALVGGIATLADVDYKDVGLEGFGKPDRFLERQVDRWLGQLGSYKESDNYEGREIPGIAYVAEWLRDNIPDESHIGIIHGDYGLANALFHWEPPARLAAMIDWELSTVGDTMLDLGKVLSGYRSRDAKTPTQGSTDFPPREELADFYAEQRGRPVENLTYYMVLSNFKLASIMEGHYARSLVGKQEQGWGERANSIVLRLAAEAEAMAKGTA